MKLKLDENLPRGLRATLRHPELIISATHHRGVSTLQGGKYLEYPRQELSQVRKSVGGCPQYQHGNVELRQIPLE